MSTDVESTPEVVSIDPRDDKFYRRFRNLDLERLAWEFLRRNQEFRNDCDGSVDEPDALQLVATKWNLYRFKHYALEFSEEKRPRFLPTLVRYFPNLTECPISRKITLAPGHAAFVLNGGALLLYQQAEEAQTRRLLRRLEKFLRDLNARIAVKPKQVQLKEENYPECLQLLDLLNAEVPPDQIKLLLPSLKRNSRSEPTEKIAANNRLYKLRLQAQRLASEGYLELAVVGAARREEAKDLARAEKSGKKKLSKEVATKYK